MDTDRFDYQLPDSLIAQLPTQRRDDSRLMVIDRTTQKIEHCVFREIADHIPAATHLYRNNATVFKARIKGTRSTGGMVECLLLNPGANDTTFWCLLKPGKKLPPGTSFTLDSDTQAHVLQKKETGEFLVEFKGKPNENVLDIAKRLGEMPLPPYIERQRKTQPDAKISDDERYQTVYANPEKEVAAAAPTAGLHFTEDLLAQLTLKQIKQFEVTLHIGLGTFKPIKAERIEEHDIHKEFYEIPRDTLSALKEPDKQHLAVGTTTLRAIEDYARKSQQFSDNRTEPFYAEADIFLYPPATFSNINALITNFHLPKSTLVCLVSAFLTPGDENGIKWLKEIYQIAIDKRYRFYSYGDAMLIL